MPEHISKGDFTMNVTELPGLEILSVGEPVSGEYRKLFNNGSSDGGRLEFLSSGEYRFILGLSDLSSRERDRIKKGKVWTRIFRAPKGNVLVENAFTSLFMFDDFGPVEVFFNPAFYQKDEWKIRAEKNRETNLVSITCLDTRKWTWAALRLVSMPVKWREALSGWWKHLESNADNPSFDRGRSIREVDTWKAPIDRQDLCELWRKGEDTGAFGEKF